MRAFKVVMRWVLGVLFVLAGANHFLRPEFYVKIMPPYLPWHFELVIASGVCESLGGVGLLIPQLQRAAAWGLIALLAAVFPANVYMALHPEVGAELFPSLPPVVWWLRLPLQFVFVAWAALYTRPEEPRGGAEMAPAG